jgi:outer membrane biosynthesis protein TonB
MRQGAIFSAGLHLTVFVMLFFGLPSMAPDALLAPPIPIEIVTFVEPPEPQPEPEPEPEPIAELPPPAPKPEPLPEPEPEPEPIPLAEAEPEPEPEPEPPPEPEAEPEPEEEQVKTPPKPKMKPLQQVAEADKKKEEPPPEDRLTSILKNVEKLKEQAAESTQLADASQGRLSQASAIEQNAMVRAIQQQMARCWRIDAGARDADSLIVEIRVKLNPDATVRDAQIVDFERMFRDSFFRSAAENARRAILRCSPFTLPPNKYEVWRDLTLRFDPSRMFGG